MNMYAVLSVRHTNAEDFKTYSYVQLQKQLNDDETDSDEDCPRKTRISSDAENKFLISYF